MRIVKKLENDKVLVCDNGHYFVREGGAGSGSWEAPGDPRFDKSTQGGEVSTSGGKGKVNYTELKDRLSKLAPYKHVSSHAGIDEKGDYNIYSYDTLMATVNKQGVMTYQNKDKYSVTTSKLQNIIERTFGKNKVTLQDKVDAMAGAMPGWSLD